MSERRRARKRAELLAAAERRRKRTGAVLLAVLAGGVAITSAFALQPGQTAALLDGAQPVSAVGAVRTTSGEGTASNTSSASAIASSPSHASPSVTAHPSPSWTLKSQASASASASAVPASGFGAGIVSTSGAVNAAAYRRMAASMATDAGIAYRFGAAGSGSSGAPTAYSPSDKQWFNSGANKTLNYQVAGPVDSSKSDFSNDQGQVGYVSGSTFGVDTIQTLSMDQNTFTEKPQLAWQFYGGGHPAPDLTGSAQTAKCLAKLGVTPGHFVAQARSYAHGEASVNALEVFDNGVIAAAGTSTAQGRFCLQLPANLHPTAISITNQNEFALVTVWNTTTLQSELAVIALGGTEPTGVFWTYEWTELYPGIQNYGLPTFGKLLGTVPLPMATATGVSAVSDYSAGQWLSSTSGANVNAADLPLTNEANRQTLVSGANKAKRADAGYAVVFSREEHKVAFVDLQPLFDQISDAYFGDHATFASITANIGQGATQWPKVFSALPAEQPKVVKTVVMANAPTAVAAMLSGPATPRAYVATADGTLHTFEVGGLASGAAATAAGVVEAGTIQVGANPTSITYLKDRPNDTSQLDKQLIVTARGASEVQWVALSGDGGSVVRTLRDSRLVDPIAAEFDNTHGTDSQMVTIADYGAGKVFTYRYGPVVFATNGGATYGVGADGHADFEFGGAYDPGGKPFSISITNVT